MPEEGGEEQEPTFALLAVGCSLKVCLLLFYCTMVPTSARAAAVALFIVQFVAAPSLQRLRFCEKFVSRSLFLPPQSSVLSLLTNISLSLCCLAVIFHEIGNKEVEFETAGGESDVGRFLVTVRRPKLR